MTYVVHKSCILKLESFSLLLILIVWNKMTYSYNVWDQKIVITAHYHNFLQLTHRHTGVRVN